MCIQTEWEHYTLRPIKPYACGIGWGSHATAPLAAPPCSTNLSHGTGQPWPSSTSFSASPLDMRMFISSVHCWILLRPEGRRLMAHKLQNSTEQQLKKKMHLRMTMSQVCPNLDPPLVVQHHHGKWPISRWFTSYISMSHFPWQTAPETTPPC